MSEAFTGSNGNREDGTPSRDFLAGQLSVLYAIEELSMRGEARVPIEIHRVVMPMNPRETDPYAPGLIQAETVHAVPVAGLYENIMRKLGEIGAYSYVDSYAEHALRMALLHLRGSQEMCDSCIYNQKISSTPTVRTSLIAVFMARLFMRHHLPKPTVEGDSNQLNQ